ncbi:aldehyde dehydrogenase family protein [Microbulbifer flavimaris]|uniref:aldehyde dehydrogenase (NAD(+)) n=1 Tax=Microbulbifer flavimaris TaxID=1781068 RepID=A0ABX4I1R7_9GAMM|nr:MULTISPECIES: aldehyde dehydrogenase family protein [Microbulbifer]KUJ84285.1 aldehyde dehydrogenase [Microbulbifer sp. ZGT114]PCO06365.1 aldehyde dehydrogenase family protein [Microbulbifer flavimaris]
MTDLSKLHTNKLYINGQWQDSSGGDLHAVICPATEEKICDVIQGTAEDVDEAVRAARDAFKSWRTTTAAERAAFLNAIADGMEARKEELIEAVSVALGCPPHITEWLHVDGPIYSVRYYAERAQLMEKTEKAGHSLIMREPVGVCGFITPWNYPLHQFVGKVAPAIAAGCTMIAKPSEMTPLQDYVMAEIIDSVGLPAGVFNLVPGAGPIVGAALSAHPDIDMVSFTGSTRAGVEVARAAAPTVKRVCQELGGKSPFIVTPDADLEAAVRWGCEDVFINTGQTCTALTRMLVPADRYEEAVEIAKRVAEEVKLGKGGDAFMGPLSSARQRDIVRSYIDKGIDEGARLVAGGSEAPADFPKGFYVKPTVFADVTNDMTIAREEIFGPVTCLIPYKDLDEAIAIANDSEYGLSSGVWARDAESALPVVRRLEAGLCFVNGGEFNYDAPFGGFKRSGNGREFGEAGLDEFIELKSVQMPA